MFLHLENFLTPSEVQVVSQISRQAKFIEGRRSNPHNVTKDNVIVDPNDPQGQKAGQIGLAAFQRSEEARNFALPKRVATPSLVRYGTSMKYGPHIDAAFLAVGSQPQPLRSDISCTIFVNDPAEYQGGELVIHLGAQTARIKGKAGSAVFYPSTTLHEVIPVTQGERVVMISFIESQVPDPMQRDLIYTLNEVRALEGLKMDWRNRTQLEYVIQNLLRMWSR
jgi:PKHD-type hydroxylase